MHLASHADVGPCSDLNTARTLGCDPSIGRPTKLQRYPHRPPSVRRLTLSTAVNCLTHHAPVNQSPSPSGASQDGPRPAVPGHFPVCGVRGRGACRPHRMHSTGSTGRRGAAHHGRDSGTGEHSRCLHPLPQPLTFVCAWAAEFTLAPPTPATLPITTLSDFGPSAFPKEAGRQWVPCVLGPAADDAHPAHCACQSLRGGDGRVGADCRPAGHRGDHRVIGVDSALLHFLVSLLVLLYRLLRNCAAQQSHAVRMPAARLHHEMDMTRLFFKEKIKRPPQMRKSTSQTPCTLHLTSHFYRFSRAVVLRRH